MSAYGDGIIIGMCITILLVLLMIAEGLMKDFAEWRQRRRNRRRNSQN